MKYDEIQSLKIGYVWISGWWFGTSVSFPYIGNNHPNQLTNIFQRV